MLPPLFIMLAYLNLRAKLITCHAISAWAPAAPVLSLFHADCDICRRVCRFDIPDWREFLTIIFYNVGGIVIFLGFAWGNTVNI